MTEHYDLVIIGAGISGIGLAYHLKKRCPNKTFAILEGRGNIGGTWDYFKYPGLRTDSDMKTFAYDFHPWAFNENFATGEQIMDYLNEVVATYKIREHIIFNQKVKTADFQSNSASGGPLWTVRTANGSVFTSQFLIGATGYYDFDEGYVPDIPGMNDFIGTLVHTQQWTDDIEYEGKEVVVIGSGATAVTIIPAICKRTKHVTMLQRTPTYIMGDRPWHAEPGALNSLLMQYVPGYGSLYNNVKRQLSINLVILWFWLCRKYPEEMKKDYLKGLEKILDKDQLEPFVPSYNMWTQRVCFAPDADFHLAYKNGDMSIVTDHIETITPDGILLQSKKKLKADLIVLATGLKLVFGGKVKMSVDGKLVDPSQLLVYKGFMWSDIPNLFFMSGYTNNSWTLKVDLVGPAICDMVQYMDRKYISIACPEKPDREIETAPFLDFDSSYIKRIEHLLPKQGTNKPWTLPQNYWADYLTLRWGSIKDPNLRLSKI